MFGLEKGIGNNRYLTFTFANTSNQNMQKIFRFQETFVLREILLLVQGAFAI